MSFFFFFSVFSTLILVFKQHRMYYNENYLKSTFIDDVYKIRTWLDTFVTQQNSLTRDSYEISHQVIRIRKFNYRIFVMRAVLVVYIEKCKFKRDILYIRLLMRVYVFYYLLIHLVPGITVEGSRMM